MAKLEKLVPLILKWEGGYVNDPADLGGPTNQGVTLSTWKKQGYDKNGDGAIDVEDLKLISKDDVVERILRPHYWNRWQADRIDSQALANILVDWVWGSGRYGITIPQEILAVEPDGIVGEKTLHALNAYPDPEDLFEKIKRARRTYFSRICIDRPANKRFLKGWLNRLNEFKWIAMMVLFCFPVSCRTTVETQHATSLQTEQTKQTIETLHARSLQTEQNETTSENSNERRLTETITALFDTLDAKPVLKALQIQRTVSDKNVLSDRQTVETRHDASLQMEETEQTGQRVESLHTKSLQPEQKKKAAWKTMVGWIVGGALAVLGWVVLRKETKLPLH